MQETRRNRGRGDWDLVSIRWSRRESHRAAPVRLKRTRRRSDERTRDRCAARYRCGKIALKRFLRLSRLFRAVFKAREVLQESKFNLADRTISLFGNNKLSLAFQLCSFLV